jgi:thiamine kinase-like enzyme
LEKGWMKRFLLPAYVLVQPDDGKTEKIANSLGGMVFGGQGNKVKIFKFDEGIVLNFLKQGYDKESLLKEISVRETFQDLLPIPKLLKVNKEFGFFEEEYIPSVPLRNLNKKTWPLLTDLFEKLFIYYKNNSVNPVSYYDYQEMVIDEIKGKTAFLDDVTRKKVLEMISIFCESCRQDQNDETFLIQSHGDFWLGNILCDEKSKKLFIVDWERADQYSLMHDFFTLFAVYSIEQRSMKLMSYILDLKTNNNPVSEILQKYHNQFSVNLDRSFLEKHLAIFLLEKIQFSLRNPEGEIFVLRDEETEIQKWYRFFKDILNKGLLAGFVQ